MLNPETYFRQPDGGTQEQAHLDFRRRRRKLASVLYSTELLPSGCLLHTLVKEERGPRGRALDRYPYAELDQGIGLIRTVRMATAQATKASEIAEIGPGAAFPVQGIDPTTVYDVESGCTVAEIGAELSDYVPFPGLGTDST